MAGNNYSICYFCRVMFLNQQLVLQLHQIQQFPQLNTLIKEDLSQDISLRDPVTTSQEALLMVHMTQLGYPQDHRVVSSRLDHPTIRLTALLQQLVHAETRVVDEATNTEYIVIINKPSSSLVQLCSCWWFWILSMYGQEKLVNFECDYLIL